VVVFAPGLKRIGSKVRDSEKEPLSEVFHNIPMTNEDYQTIVALGGDAIMTGIENMEDSIGDL